MKERAWTLFVSVWMLSVVFSSVLVDADDDHDDHDEYEYYYMEDYCNTENLTTIFVGQDSRSPYGFLKATRSGYITSSMNCTVKLQVQSDHHLSTRFTDIELDCQRSGYVEIVGETNNPTKFCGYGMSGSLSSVGNWLKFKFVTGANYPYSEDGFSLSYTEYYTGGCKAQDSSEFQCSVDSRCIDSDVKCDGIDNCGDWSDETTSACGLSTGAIVAIVICSTLVGLTLILSLFYCIHSYYAGHKNKRDRNGTAVAPAGRNAEPTVHYSTNEQTVITAMPPVPPPYTFVNMAYPTAGDQVGPEGEFPAPPIYDDIVEPKDGANRPSADQ